MMSRFLLLIVLSSFAASWSLAQSDTATPSEMSEIVRYEYRGKDTVPDYLAFFATANRIQHRSLANPDRALANARAIFGVADESTAVQLVDQVTAYLSDLQADYQQLEVAALCNGGEARTRESLYRVLDNLEDARQGLLLKHYNRFVTTLNKSEQAALINHLQDAKKGQQYIALDHEAAYEAASLDIKVVAAERCQQLGGAK